MGIERGILRKKKKLLLNYKMADPLLQLHNNGLCYVHLSSVATQLYDITQMGDAKTHNMKVIRKI